MPKIFWPIGTFAGCQIHCNYDRDLHHKISQIALKRTIAKTMLFDRVQSMYNEYFLKTAFIPLQFMMINWSGKKQGAVTFRMDHQENKVTKMFILENELSWKATTESTSLYFRIQTVKSTKHSTHSSSIIMRDPTNDPITWEMVLILNLDLELCYWLYNWAELLSSVIWPM